MHLIDFNQRGTIQNFVHGKGLSLSIQSRVKGTNCI